MNNEQKRQLRIKLYIILMALCIIGMINTAVKGDIYYFEMDDGPGVLNISGYYRNITIYNERNQKMHLENLRIVVQNNGTIKGDFSGYCVIGERQWYDIKGDLIRGSFRNNRLNFTLRFSPTPKIKDFRFSGRVDKNGIISGTVSGKHSSNNFRNNISWQSKSNGNKWNIDITVREVNVNERTKRSQANGRAYVTLSSGVKIHFQVRGTIFKDRNKYYMACQAKDKAVLHLVSQNKDRLIIRMYRDYITSVSGKIRGVAINDRSTYMANRIERVEKPYVYIYAGDDEYNTNVRNTLGYVDKYYGGYYH